jgi:putative tryptophan/tyrosine transport system substrate-binding protein
MLFDAVVVLMTNLLLQTSDKLAAMALERRLPTICGYREHVLVGSLIRYGVDLRWIYLIEPHISWTGY